MKKILIYSLTLGLILPMFNGCKKGSEDPGLSLRSRDNRITGTWELVEITETHSEVETFTQNNLTTTTTTNTDISFNGSNLQTITNVTIKAPDTTTYTISKNVDVYKLKIEILKDNTAKVEESSTQSESCFENSQNCVTVKISDPTSTSNNYSGNWYWADSKKNKIGIMGPHNYFSGNIKRLSNDELIFEEVYEDFTEDKSVASTKSTKTNKTTTYTYKKI